MSQQELSNVQYLLIFIVRNLTLLSLVMCCIVMFYVWTIVPFMEAWKTKRYSRAGQGSGKGAG